MKVWHLTRDATRAPMRVLPGDRVTLTVGTWPIEPGQDVWVEYRSESREGRSEDGRCAAAWIRNIGPNSYWRAELGPFDGDTAVHYTIHATSRDGKTATSRYAFRVARPLHLAILWHQHQPLYRDPDQPSARGSYLQPWVRLHAIRDYFSMAALVAEHPGVHLTINLTPVLLEQIRDYVDGGATDRALELTLRPAADLSPDEREEILATFFDADWHNQIFRHARYRELFEQRRDARPFSDGDVRDLQMWFNLAWFGSEFRAGSVRLPTGHDVSVGRFVEQQRDFSVGDIEAMVGQQYRLLEAVVPMHRLLQDRGQVEISTTPYFHPILPLLIDTDQATIDRPGAEWPTRFAEPADADEHVRRAVAAYRSQFGRSPRGMWPAEGAVSRATLPVFARHGIRWIATDRGVLARSGRWGYDASRPDVLCEPYQGQEADARLSLFFRESGLSDAIGFHYHSADPEEAATAFVERVRTEFARRVEADADHVLTVALDGENAWGAYRDDARPFLHALYTRLEREPAIRTVTFAEYLDGNPERNIDPHALDAQPVAYELFTGSWVDENGSAPGVDLGTWIGEPEENRAWDLLRTTRAALRAALQRTTGAEVRVLEAYDSMLAAEGSDWFWWFGDDQNSGNDPEFDDLFRRHLKGVYRELHLAHPQALDEHIVPHAVIWSFTAPVSGIQPFDRLTVRTNCPGVLTWRLDDRPPASTPLSPAGGVMAGVHRYHCTLGPFPEDSRTLRFSFECTHAGCTGGLCCSPQEHIVSLRR